MAAHGERAFSNDSELCPGGTYLDDLDSLLRADPWQRAQIYEQALAGGWLDVSEIREAENLPPRGGGD